MSKLAILCSGQGSQFVGMGLDFIQAAPHLEDKLNMASRILGFDVESLLKDDEKINNTLYTQPLIVLTTALIFDRLNEIYALKPDALAGFSLGEYSALYAAGVYDFETVLKIIKTRAQLMTDAASKYPGSMAAILQLDTQTIERICKELSDDQGIVIPANYNSPGQLVISGAKDKVELAAFKMKEAGARRTVILAVSGAFHSPYMKEAGILLKEYLNQFEAKKPNVDIYSNYTAKAVNINKLPELLEAQIQSPVLFQQTIENLISQGYDRFLEIGPGAVLSGLVKKINPNVKVTNVSTYADLEKVKEIL